MLIRITMVAPMASKVVQLNKMRVLLSNELAVASELLLEILVSLVVASLSR